MLETIAYLLLFASLNGWIRKDFRGFWKILILLRCGDYLLWFDWLLHLIRLHVLLIFACMVHPGENVQGCYVGTLTPMTWAGCNELVLVIKATVVVLESYMCN